VVALVSLLRSDWCGALSTVKGSLEKYDADRSTYKGRRSHVCIVSNASIPILDTWFLTKGVVKMPAEFDGEESVAGYGHQLSQCVREMGGGQRTDEYVHSRLFHL
jgi:hypothetical protein